MTIPSKRKRCPLPKIGYIGTGRMGVPMIEQLISKGYDVQCFDVSTANKEKLTGLGATWKESPREAAADADLVFTCLPLPVHVYEKMVGDEGAAIHGLKAGAVWADFSTTDYHNTLRIADVLKAKGVQSLECPVTNLHQMGVEVCNAAMFVGGDIEAFEKARAGLDAMMEKVFHVGKIGEAQTVKLLTNTTFYSECMFGGEVLAVAVRAGIPAHHAWAHLTKGIGNSAALRHFIPCTLDGSYDHSCSIEVAHKDVNLMHELDVEFLAKGHTNSADRVLPALLRQCTKLAERFPVVDNHMRINVLTEEDNPGVSLRAATGWTSPSHHGADRSYRIPGFFRDAVGRRTPIVADKYFSSSFVPSAEQARLLEDLSEWLAFTNYMAYLDAEALGMGMGLAPDYIHELVTWSVGTSWISDNITDYKVDAHKVAAKAEAFSQGARLPATRFVIDRVAERASTEDSWRRPVADLSTLTEPVPLHIETISLSKLKDLDAAEIAKLFEEFKDHGIVRLEVDSETAHESLASAKTFFDLPDTQKAQFAHKAQSVYPANCRGYVAVRGEQLNPGEGPCVKECFDLGFENDPLPADPKEMPFNGPTYLPDKEVLPEFSVNAFAAQQKVMNDIVPTFVRAIDHAFETNQSTALAPLMDKPTLIQRYIQYPPGCSFAGRHTDNGVFTVLFHTLSPCEIMYKGKWRRLAPQEATGNAPYPVVFVGDLLEFWSEGKCTAIPHRVKHKGTSSRRSCAFFIYPNVKGELQSLQGRKLKVEESMLKNFVSIWQDGHGAGEGQSYLSKQPRT